MSNLWGLWWGSIKGNGPEDLTSLLIVGIVSAVVYPPIRNWFKQRERDIHLKLEHNATLLRHVIKHHPDIPNEDHEGNSLIETETK